MFADMLNIPRTQVIGTGFDRFVGATDREACRQLIDGGWRVKSKVEVTLLNEAGRDVPCLLSVRALDLDDGPSLSVIVTDLTDEKANQLLLRQNNDRLAEANAALEVSNNTLNMLNANLQQFAYVASHDLQEPLRKIQQFGNLLRLTYPDALGEQGADWLGRMESAAARMSILIRDLLAYSRLTVPVDVVVEQPLNAIVTDVLGVLDLPIRETGAVVDVADLGMVPADASQLGQVFQNLIGNALKFVKPGVPPRITVSRRNLRRADLPRLFQSATTHRHFCALRVTDNGIGFDAQQAERIFGTFQRLHGKNQYPGTGIGLAIVKRVVENHRGFVTAKSQPGEGATFTIYLPIGQV
jgi:light-regulated signal transduction histidine kinase (bacteriophytochrome)